MERVSDGCAPFRAGVRPALEQALKELIEVVLKEKRGAFLIKCRMFFDEVNFDNLCVRCILDD